MGAVGGLLPICNGMENGFMSVSTYDSVMMKRAVSSYDMDNLNLKTGIYAIHSDYVITNNKTDIKFGTLIVFNGRGLGNGGDPIIQIAISINLIIKIRFYWFEGWGNWRQISTI